MRSLIFFLKVAEVQIKKTVNMAAHEDEVDVCESWEDMDEISVSFD